MFTWSRKLSHVCARARLTENRKKLAHPWKKINQKQTIAAIGIVGRWWTLIHAWCQIKEEDMDHIIEVVVKVSAAARVILLRELYAQRSHVAFVPTTTTSFVLEWCENRVMKCGEANNDDRHVYYGCGSVRDRWDAVDSCECCVRCQNSKWSCHTVYNADTLNTFETRWMSFLFVSCITFRAFLGFFSFQLFRE